MSDTPFATDDISATQSKTEDSSELSPLEAKLMSLEYKKFVEFDLRGTKAPCVVLRVHDGDTMTIGFKLSSKFYKKNIRLENIDTPELRSTVDLEARVCRISREYIQSRYLGKIVNVEMGTMDKYGRILATVFDRETGECVNDKLVELKFARVYGGDLHKCPWDLNYLNSAVEIAGGLGISGDTQ
jgi:endonuclease YncB( thermonuclease family)